MKKKQNYIDKAIKNVILIVGMIILGYLLLVISYLLPASRMALSLHISTDIFERESYYYSPSTANLDNYTDGCMLLIAAHDPEQLQYRAKLVDVENVKAWSDESVWKRALRGTYVICETENLTPPERIIDLYGENLPSDNTYYSVDYARYWHGYLVYLKPLLMVSTYSQIRNILALIQLGLFTTLICILAKYGNAKFVPGIFAFWIFCNPTATMSSLQYTSVFVITISACIALCLYAEKMKKNNKTAIYKADKDMDHIGLLFCLIGGLTSYFDFFTYPIVTLGVPLLLWLCIRDKSNVCTDNIELAYGKINIDWIWNSVSWVMGYGGVWAGKWVLASLVLGENIIGDAIGQVLFRTGIKSTDANGATFEVENMKNNTTTLFEVLKAQKGFGMQYANLIMIILFIVMMIISIIYWAYRKLRNRENIEYKVYKTKSMLLKFVPIIIIAFYPFIWYMCVKNHSMIHAWMTYRDLGITVVAGWFALAILVEKKD